MKQCPNCKRELKEDLIFCPFDGTALSDGSAQDVFIGLLLDDKYRLDEKVGEGGMGTVYRATHVQMENTVAVKILHPQLASDQYAVERFRREARSAAQIRHPNAVAVTDFGVTKVSGVAYLVMEFLEGEDLRQRIKHKGRLDLEEAFLIMSETCSAVSAAHSRGIIHRDLKPDNIWLIKTETGVEHVKVLDFGIAKLKASTDAVNLTQKGTIVGTPYYMSPEQCRSEELEAGSDVYSLGVILYEMLTGRVPFDGSTPLAVVLKHNTEHPRPLRQLHPDIPEPVEKVVLRALEKKREDRQESATQLARELQAALYASGSRAAKHAGSGTRAFDSGGVDPKQAARSSDSTLAFDGANSRPAATAKASDDFEQGSTHAYSGDVPGGLKDWVTEYRTRRGTLDYSVQAPRAVTTDGMESPRSRMRNLRLYAIVGSVVLASAITALVLMRLVGGTPPVSTEPTATGVPPGMALVKGATFTMGTDDPTARAEWRPAHPITVQDCYLDVNEVTNEDYFRFAKQTGHSAPPHWKDGNFPKGEAKLPVFNVSWFDAKAYAEWAGKRLPSEAEWEYAARGTDNRIYPWGNQWFDELSNSGEDKRGKPVAVGSFPRGASPSGILDMAGNVAEWVADDFALYPGSTAKPLPGYKVYRGGSYAFPKDQLLTTARWTEVATEKLPYVGFRCAKDVSK